MPITAREKSEVDAANLSGKEPVAFIHGLWLLPNSWDSWRGYFEDLGFATLAPGWPDDPASIEEALANPDVFANKSINEICQHLADVVKGLTRKPIIVGHSFGGLLTEKLAGLGFATASIAISPAPYRGVLPLPVSALKAAFPVLKKPRRTRARRFACSTSSSASRSQTRCRRTKRRRSTTSTRCPAPERSCSRPRSPISIRGRRQRS